MTEMLSLSEIEALARDCLTRAGVATDVAATVARDVTVAEGTGLAVGGLKGLLRDIHLIRYGRLLPNAEPVRAHPKPGLFTVDAGHGFAAYAAADTVAPLCRAADTLGVAALFITHCSAPDALAFAVTQIARNGLMVEVQSDLGLLATAAAETDGPRLVVSNVQHDSAYEDPLGGLVSRHARLTVYATMGEPSADESPAGPDEDRTVAVPADLLAALIGA